MRAKKKEYWGRKERKERKIRNNSLDIIGKQHTNQPHTCGAGEATAAVMQEKKAPQGLEMWALFLRPPCGRHTTKTTIFQPTEGVCVWGGAYRTD